MIIFALKKGSSQRFCIDCRKLNIVTVRDAYPIQERDECLDSLAEMSIFSTLYAKLGYWQIEIDAQDSDIVTFTSHHCLYRFLRWPFGLNNQPPNTVQRALDTIFSAIKCQFALKYMDDVIISLSPVEQHLDHIQTVIRLLSRSGILLQLKRYFLFKGLKTAWVM